METKYQRRSGIRVSRLEDNGLQVGCVPVAEEAKSGTSLGLKKGDKQRGLGEKQPNVAQSQREIFR